MLVAKKKPKTKYQIKRRTPFNDDLLPVIQNLTAEGRSLADIGMLLGYAGKSPAMWMRFLKNKHPEVADAIETGAQMADTKLIVTAFDAATGYDVEEVDIEYIAKPVIDGKGLDKIEYIEKSRKTKQKHIRPDTSLLFKLLCNRLPEYFSDIRKFEIDKRSANVKIDMNKEISEFAGKLMQATKDRKQVESKEVETENGQ
jgi:hypothetical protein